MDVRHIFRRLGACGGIYCLLQQEATFRQLLRFFPVALLPGDDFLCGLLPGIGNLTMFFVIREPRLRSR